MSLRSPLWRPAWLHLGAALLAAVVAAGAQAAQVQVLGLFPGKALLSIDGKHRVLSVGQRSPEGVLLVSADPHSAVIESDGQRRTLGLSHSVGGVFAEPSGSEARILRDNHGGYSTVGAINGQMVNLLVDTGASAVVLNSKQAEQLGLQYRLDGKRIGVQTASGFALGYAVKLDSVRVGDILVHGVDAMVIRGNFPQRALLGMTFLDRVHIENKGGMMVLRAKLD